MGCKPLLKATKQKHKKGLWSSEEDLRLREYVTNHGHGCWSSIPINAGLLRTGKSCRLRWMNYLRPGLKREMLTESEEQIIWSLHAMLGNKWSQIAQQLPGRTDNEIKNYWHSYHKKKIYPTEQYESSNTAENTSLNTTGTDPSPYFYSQTSVVRCGSFNSYRNVDRSSLNRNQETVSPKVLFAEWLSLDQFQGQGFSAKNGSTEALEDVNSKEEIDDSFLNDFLLNEGVFSCGFISENDALNHFDRC